MWHISTAATAAAIVTRVWSGQQEKAQNKTKKTYLEAAQHK
jgi:hypothetical protein